MKILLVAVILLSSTIGSFAQSAPAVSLGGSVGITGGQSLSGQTSIVMTDATHTLVPNEWWAGTLKVTSSVALTATRQIIAPLNAGQAYNIENSTTGGQSITIIGASGTGVTVANGSSASVFSDGTNYIQVSGSGGGSGTVTHSTGALTANHVVIGNGTGDVKVDTGASTDGAGNLTVNSITANGSMNGGQNFTYVGTPATAPTTNQFQISPAVPITTPWSYSPAATPGNGFIKGVNTGGVVQQSFESQVNLASEVTGILSPAQLALIPGIAGANYYFGDSLTSPSGITDAGIARQMAMRLGSDMLGQKISPAFSGVEMDQIVGQLLSTFPPAWNTTSYVPKIWYEGGANNALIETITTGSINNFSLEYAAGIAWAQIPTSNKVYASAATKTGTWAANALLTLEPSNTGTAMSSTTNASTLSFSLPASGTFAGITYYAPATANGGTFTFAIDGVLQTDVCSGTTTFANTGCNGVAVINGQGAFHQQFAVSVGTHTGVVTVTSATSASNTVYILDVDISPTSKVGLPFMLASGVLRQLADAQSASTAAFDTAQAAVVAAYSWANILRVDVRGGTPGVNTTTDFNATTACPGGVSPVHPNSCGYNHWVQTVENTAASAGWNIFYPGVGINPTGSLTGYSAYGPITTGDVPTGTNGSFQVKSIQAATSINGANPNVFNNGVPSASLFSQLNCSFTAATGNPACEGLTWDSGTSRFMMALISTYEMGFQHCINSNSTTGPSGCTVEFYTDPVTHIATTKFGLNTPIVTGSLGVTFATNTAAGTGATAVCYTANSGQCTASSGTVTLTTGTISVPAAGDIVDITLTTGALSAFAFNCTVAPYGVPPQAAYTLGLGVDSQTSARFEIAANVAPTASTVYQFTYTCGN